MLAATGPHTKALRSIKKAGVVAKVEVIEPRPTKTDSEQQPRNQMHHFISQVDHFDEGTTQQAWGRLQDGNHFYFRARYSSWGFGVGKTEDSAVDGVEWYWEEPWSEEAFGASYMPEDVARRIIRSCVEMYVKKVVPPRQFVGTGAEQVRAFLLAHLVMGDVALYSKDVTEPVLGERIDEGRALFRESVVVEHHGLYEQALQSLAARRKGSAVHHLWLLDSDSVKSMAARHVFYLKEVDKRAEESARLLRFFHPQMSPGLRPAYDEALK